MENFISKFKINKNIIKIILTNGKKINPLSLAVIKNLRKEIEFISNQKETKVIIISSNGPGFSAGHDLEELKLNHNNKEFYLELFNECSELMKKILKIPQPVIAEVPGVAAAAGCPISCNLRPCCCFRKSYFYYTWCEYRFILLNANGSCIKKLK